jgi:deoxyribodipyrimidine photolyase-related protein
MQMAEFRTLRLILGDQLNSAHSWYVEADPQVLYVLAELRQETDYVRHHVQKICGFFAAMESFARQLRAQGHQVLHLTLDDTQQWPDLADLVRSLVQEYQVDQFEYQRPDEFRLLQLMEQLTLPAQVTVRQFDSEHFLLPFAELENYFEAGKQVRMEFFYRRMRRRYGFLMDGDQPAGGRWNFDVENRQRLRPEDIQKVPAPLVFNNDVSDILKRLEHHGVDSIGTARTKLPWPVNREQALQLLEHFCEHCLPNFGRFQDAMTSKSDHRWSLYHSRLSFALNTKILSPREVIEAVIAQYNASAAVDIAQVEGFVRQILGWREYIRGIYWTNMPSYRQSNGLNANRPLPEFFWTGQTKMKCMQEAIGQSLNYSYAHHIQRLMVTGNFCLLAGIDPAQVDDWYLGIYIDALEWVEMPNTRGMSQFADGGIVASKPYAASGNYLNKMSDYCKGCHYNVKQKTEDTACPLNSLYWHFMLRHREQLASNRRIGMIYRNWDRLDEENRSAVQSRAEWLLHNLDQL